MRSKLVCRFYNYYWKTVSIEESLNQVKILDLKITSEDELLGYVQEEINNHINIFEGFPYEIQIIPFKNSNKGAVIFKFDHVFSDGLGIVSAICCLSNNYDVNLFPPIMRTPKIPWYINIINYLMFPIYVPMVFYSLIMKNVNDTPLRKSKIPSGKSRLCVTKPYDIAIFTKPRKDLNVSFNDIILSIMSIAIKKFCGKPEFQKEFPNVTEIKSIIAVGRKRVPNSMEEVLLNNEATGISFELPLVNNINDAKRLSKIVQPKIRNLGYITACEIMAHLFIEFLPTDLYHFLNNKFSQSVDIIVSNVPGPNSTLYYGNSKLIMIAPIATTANIRSFLPMITYNNTVRFVYSVDVDSGIDEKEFIKYLGEAIDSIESKSN